MCPSRTSSFDSSTSSTSSTIPSGKSHPASKPPSTTSRPTLYHRRTSSIMPLFLTNLPSLLSTQSISSSPDSQPQNPPESPQQPIRQPTNTPYEYSEETEKSNTTRWQTMLALQRQYHCYNSARLSAAVQALENGLPLQYVPIRDLETVDGPARSGSRSASPDQGSESVEHRSSSSSSCTSARTLAEEEDDAEDDMRIEFIECESTKADIEMEGGFGVKYGIEFEVSQVEVGLSPL